MTFTINSKGQYEEKDVYFVLYVVYVLYVVCPFVLCPLKLENLSFKVNFPKTENPEIEYDSALNFLSEAVMNGATHVTAKNQAALAPSIKLSKCRAIFQQDAMIQIIASYSIFKEFALNLRLINRNFHRILHDDNSTAHKRLEQHRTTSAMQRTLRQKPIFAEEFCIAYPHYAQFTLSIPFASKLRTGVAEVLGRFKQIYLVGPCTSMLGPDWTFLGENGTYALGWSDSGVIRLISYSEERSWALKFLPKSEADHKEMAATIVPYFTNLNKSFVSNNTLYTVSKEWVGQFRINPQNLTITLLNGHKSYLQGRVYKITNPGQGEFLHSEPGNGRKAFTLRCDNQFGLTLSQNSDLSLGQAIAHCSNSNNVFAVIKDLGFGRHFNLYAFRSSLEGLKEAWREQLILPTVSFREIVLQADDDFIAVAYTHSKNAWELIVYPSNQGKVSTATSFRKEFAGALPQRLDLHSGLLSFNTSTHLECYYLKAPGKPVCVGRISKSPEATACLRVVSARDIRVMNSTEQDQGNQIYRLAYHRLPEPKQKS